MRTVDSLEKNKYSIGGFVTAYPGNEEELIELMRLAHSERWTVVPQGGGTKDAMGLLNQTPDLVLSLKRMAGVVDHPAGDMTVTVLPGTTIARLQSELVKHRQFLPVDPPWPEHSTIGGVVSANVTGPKRAMYGSSRDLLLGARIVYPDGRLIRTGAKTVKNVAGYDMNKLFIGAMGTLGIISELTFKLRPIPKFSANIIVTHPEADQLKQLQVDVLDSFLEPVAFELVNPTLLSKLGVESNAHALVFAFEDVEKSVRYQVDWIQKQAAERGMTVLKQAEQAEAAAFWERYVNLIPNSLQADSGKCIVSLKIICLLTQIQEVLSRIEQMALEQDLPVVAMGGAATGIGHLVLETSLDDTDKVIEWISRSRTLLNEIKGHLIIQFAPADIRERLSVWGEERADFKLMRAIKAKIDPLRLLNPGRFVGGI
jgi:glycolate oxidase FAD binding subunit